MKDYMIFGKPTERKFVSSSVYRQIKTYGESSQRIKYIRNIGKNDGFLMMHKFSIKDMNDQKQKN